MVGSHKVGRIEHVIVGKQTGADVERVEMLKKVCPLVHVELEAGDALFFHANVLHTSDQNSSNRRRWAFIISYNRASNNPVLPHHHPFYTPLKKVRVKFMLSICNCVAQKMGVLLCTCIQVPNTAILSCQTLDTTGKAFMDPKTDRTGYASKSNKS